MKIELSVIIVNYNGFKYLEGCLNSLIQKLSKIIFEIIIIDNNSSDESCNFIRTNYPEVKLIESNINYGFGRGNNEAVKTAKGEYLLLINNDTIVLDYLKPVLDFLKYDKNIGLVGINMLNAQKKYLPAAGKFPNYSNMFQLKNLLDLGNDFKLGVFKNEYYEVDWLGGSFFMLSKKMYFEINGFDEDYFMYVEDVDFCKKIKNKAYKIIFLPNFRYIHFVGFNDKKNKMLIDGYKIYIKKHFSGFQKIILLDLLYFNSIVKKIKSIF